jgi:hypothetical protein
MSRFFLPAATIMVVFAGWMFAQGTRVACSCPLTPEQVEILSHMSIKQLPDGQGGTCKTIRITGVNVQIVNGLGDTDTKNCVGNLLVGYAEMGHFSGTDDRTGSHNIMVGRRNNFSSWGGFVGGLNNALVGSCSGILAGEQSTAWGQLSGILSGVQSSALGRNSAVVGGDFATASGGISVVVGGRHNTASDDWSVVVGGSTNTADGRESVTVGGTGNSATGTYSVVSGGRLRTAAGVEDWVAGSLLEDS